MSKTKPNLNILKFYEQATSLEIEQGKNWFLVAHEICSQISEKNNLSIEIVASVISALSPSTYWERNIIDAATLCAAFVSGNVIDEVKVTTYGKNKEKAWRILSENNPDLLNEKSLKTFCFKDNILQPKLSKRVTIDRHAAKIYYGKYKAGKERLTNKLYLTIENSYVKTAHYIGIIPCELEAICWVAYKRIVNRSGQSYNINKKINKNAI